MPHKFIVYVIDDNASIRKALGRVLSSAGMAHQTFASGKEFFRSVAAHAKGCVILDIDMPEMSGPEVHAKMIELGYCLSVIVVSARDDDKTRRLARELGAVGFLNKPVDNQVLLTAILSTRSPEFGPANVSRRSRNQQATD